MHIFARRTVVIVLLVAAIGAPVLLFGSERASAAATATFAVNAPPNSQTVGVPFTVTVDLSDVTFDATHPFWGGYGLEVSYDARFLSVNSVTPGLCPQQDLDWALINTNPVNTGCIAQISTAASGTLETISFTCTSDGTSSLHIRPQPYSELNNGSGLTFAMTFVDGSLVCGTGVIGPTSTPTVGPSPTPTSTPPPFVAGSATIRVSAPAGPQPLSRPFDMTVDLSSWTPSVSQPAWAGWNIELAYDYTRVPILAMAPTSLCPLPHWGSPGVIPYIDTGCAFMNSTATGPLQTMTALCLQDGTATFQFVYSTNPARFSEMFDRFARPFAMTRVDGTVTCDRHADEDNDACTNAAEVGLGLDPLNRWDFFDVPTPREAIVASPPALWRDGDVSAVDAQAVFGYFAADAHVGTPLYDQDLDHDGVPDGMAYDRSVLGPAKSGPPDGTVTVTDAQLAFAQFKLGYRC